MKILVDGMPKTVGGIGSLLVNVTECNDENSNLVFEFIVPKDSSYIPYLKEKGYIFFIAPSVKKIIKYRHFVKQLFTQNKYDFLWFNNTSKVNILLPKYAKKYGQSKIIAHTHGTDIEEKGIKRVIFKIIDRINSRSMFALIDIPFACSEEAADIYYKGNKSLRDKTVVLKNGIETAKYEFSIEGRNKIRQSLRLKENDILLGAVGRLTKVKNYPFIIDLLRELDKRFKLVIVGDGEDRTELQGLIKKYDLEDRCFLVGIQHNVPDYLSAMDCFLIPSFNEGLPYSIIEAQASGLPCIASDSISNEIKITDLVRFAPIEDSDEWISLINDLPFIEDRKAYYEILNQSEYNINRTYWMFVESINNRC